MMLSNKIYDTMEKLVSIPGISGTESENLVAETIYEMLLEMEYFQKNKNNFGMEDIPEDPYKRKFLWAIVEGNDNSKNTLILTGHFDVVGVEEFGHLKSYAFNIKECTEKIKELSLDEEAVKDLQSGEWIFGRGTADMKYGIALDIEIIREFSEKRDFKGKVLFLAVPGEESNSEGMIAAVPFLFKLKREEKCDYCGAIVSECCIPKNEDEEIKRIYLGTVGKIMPLFFSVGKETHVGEPLKGLNPNLLISEINKLLECNSDFSDKVNNNITSPPTCLKQLDLKELYSVQTPLYAAAYYNMLTLKTSEDELLDKLKKLSLKAFNNILEDIDKKRKSFINKSLGKVQYAEVKPCVMAYEELLNKVRAEFSGFDEFIKEKINLWKKEKKDNQTIAINIVRETYEKYSKKIPMIIVSFIPPYYPHKYLQKEDDKSRRFIEIIDETIVFAENKFNEKIIKEDFFMGICDLSYTGIRENDNLKSLSHNIVGYDINYKLPLEELEKLDIPGIVFGGEGKDFHKYTERLNLPYSLNVVPELYKNIIYSLLK